MPEAMIAIEVEAPIVNHRMVIDSGRLPASAKCARAIILLEADAHSSEAANSEIATIADLILNPVLVGAFTPLTREEANGR
ncbi:MAG: hypothetical protein ACT4QA_20350 [Panacagrimonas sp.]